MVKSKRVEKVERVEDFACKYINIIVRVFTIKTKCLKS